MRLTWNFPWFLGRIHSSFFVVAPVTALLTVFWHSKKTFRQTLLPTILSKLASFGNLCFQNLFRFFEVRWILVKSFSLSFGTTISASVPDFRLLRSCSFRSSSKPRRPSPSLFTDMSFFLKLPQQNSARECPLFPQNLHLCLAFFGI